MQALKLVPTIHYFDTFGEFAKEFNVGKGDILVTNETREEILGPFREAGLEVIVEEVTEQEDS